MGRPAIRIQARPRMAETGKRTRTLDSFPSLGMGASNPCFSGMETHRPTGVFDPAVSAAAVLGSSSKGRDVADFQSVVVFGHCSAVPVSVCCTRNTEGISVGGILLEYGSSWRRGYWYCPPESLS